MAYEEAVKYWLWLVMVFGPANVRTQEIVRICNTPKEAYFVLHDPDCTLLNEKERQSVRRVRLEQAESVMQFCEKNGIGIMTWDSDLYPESLQHIYNPPMVLFYKGDPSILHNSMMLTVVGTRNPSPYSRKVADWLCHDLARCGIVLASGCAVGLDAAAHQAAIDENTPTVGVLGCGLDYDYPKENRALKQKILENGLLLTEYFPGTPPNGYHFPVRNRILAGISEAVLVLEAGAKSGALITANHACEGGKTVFCVPPHDLFDARYAGVVNFLRDGAYPVFNYLDIVYTYYLEYPHKLAMYDETIVSRTQDSLIFEKENTEKTKTMKASVRKSDKNDVSPEKRTVRAAVIPQEKSKMNASKPELTPAQQQILTLLKQGGRNVNGICEELDIEFQDATMRLMELEMAGLILNTQGDVFELAKRN